jgi:hypothetical protein
LSLFLGNKKARRYRLLQTPASCAAIAVSERHMQLSPTISPEAAITPLLHQLSCFHISSRENAPTTNMEAVAALGVVSSVIAIADFAAKLTITTGKLIRSAGDALPENEWIEEVAARNQDLALDLDRNSNTAGPLNKIDSAVTKLARRFLLESSALTLSLQELKVPRRSDGTKSTRAAVKSVFKSMLRQGDLERRHEKLVSLERQLSALLLHSIHRSQLEGFGELRDLVDRNGRDCVTVVRDSHTALIEKLRALQLSIKTVGQGVVRMEQGVGRIEQHQLNDIEQKRVEDVLQSLAYSDMNSRRDMIVDPTGSSYDWAFEDDTQATKQWLDSSVQHCWISGEPGTGKSVFTKSFRLDRRTKAALQSSTGHPKLLILDHYFWIAGDSHQRSFRAMLQHCCFQALQQYDSLARVAFPDEWGSGTPLRGVSWTANTLVAALKRVLAAPEFQTCIMIDGLDECEDKQRPELIQVLLELANTTSVRLCISSRPWHDFEKGFGGWSRLRLPENSAWDILQLICRRLELIDGLAFKNCVNNVRLFEIACEGRNLNVLYAEHLSLPWLNHPQQLIHDLFVRTDGNVLWVTSVLDTICERLAGGQSVSEVRRYIFSLPEDVEQYYYELVYTRTHSTYRMGNMSECAMALKIVSSLTDSYNPELERFALVRALQTSIGTGNGVVYDPKFFTRAPSPKFGRLQDQKEHQAVSAFVDSRCKDLMIISEDDYGRGTLQYRHRVMYDFLSCDRMQLVVDAAVPEHFRLPQFKLHLGILAARQMHECDVYESKVLSEGCIQLPSPEAETILYSHLVSYLSDLEGPLDESAIQTCSQIARSIFRLFASLGQVKPTSIDPEENTLLHLMLVLASVQQHDLLFDFIHLGSQQTLDHIRLAHASGEEPLHYYASPFPVRQVVWRRELDAGIMDRMPGQIVPRYLPCVHTSWTSFLFNLTEMGWSLGTLSRGATYVAKAFLEAGASIEVELCVGISRCHGHVCVCSDPSTHSRLYECSKPHPRTEHKHDWISAKDLLSEYLKIPEAEVLQIAARHRSAPSISHSDLLKLACETEAVWQRHVEVCVRNKIPVLGGVGQCCWIEGRG